MDPHIQTIVWGIRKSKTPIAGFRKTGDGFLEEGGYSPIPGRASNQTTEKQEVFCPFNSFVLGVTSLPSWVGLGRRNPRWGASATVGGTIHCKTDDTDGGR